MEHASTTSPMNMVSRIFQPLSSDSYPNSPPPFCIPCKMQMITYLSQLSMLFPTPPSRHKSLCLESWCSYQAYPFTDLVILEKPLPIRGPKFTQLFCVHIFLTRSILTHSCLGCLPVTLQHPSKQYLIFGKQLIILWMCLIKIISFELHRTGSITFLEIILNALKGQ